MADSPLLCPFCKATLAVELAPAQVTPALLVPEQVKPATLVPEVLKPATVTGLKLVSPPPAPVPTPAPTPAPPVSSFPAPALIKPLKGPQKKYDTRPAPLPDGTLVDARGAEWKGQESYAISHWAGKGKGRWLGGSIEGTWDQLTTPWLSPGYHSYTGMIAAWEYPVIEGLRVHNYGDPVRFNEPVVKFFEERWGWYSDMHDDGLCENDRLKSGLIEDCLADGCHAGISIRPGEKDLASVDGSKNLLTIRRTLIRLAPFALTSDPKKPNTHGGFIKAENREPKKNVKLAFEDCVFRADMKPSVHTLDLNPHNIATAKNCVVVWLGKGAYPNLPLPPGWTLTTDVSVWDTAKAEHLTKRAAWLASLPAA